MKFTGNNSPRRRTIHQLLYSTIEPSLSLVNLYFCIFLWQKLKERVSTDVNGAAEQRAPLYGSPDDAVQVGGGFTQLEKLCHAACEVFKAFWCAAARQSLVAAIQSEK